MHTFWKKHWKPPYGGLPKSLWLLLPLLLLVSHMEATTMAQLTRDDTFEDVIVEVAPYSIRFSLNDTENYELMNVTCKSIKNVEIVANEDYVCENLDPCSLYLSTLTIKSLLEEPVVTFEKTLEVNTDYAEPVTTMDEPIPGKEEIYVTWSATNRACIKSFTFEATSVGKEYKYVFGNDESEELLENLDPCQDYKIQLKTLNINQTLISNETATTRTLYAEPEVVVVTIDEYDNAQVKVSWEQPKYKTCIDFYYLKWFRKDCQSEDGNSSGEGVDQYLQFDESEEGFVTGVTEEGVGSPTVTPTNPPDVENDICIWTANVTDPNTKEFIIGQLQGCEEYGFEIYINNNGTAKCDTQYFSSPEQLPGAVTANSLELNATDVFLHWNPPVSNSKCVKFYTVTITGPLQWEPELQQRYDLSTDNTSVFCDGLVPCGQYSYVVVAMVNNVTSGAPMNATFDTLEARPSQVLNYRIEEEAYSITVSWDPPIFGELCLTGYRLSGWRDDTSPADFDKTTTDTSVIVEDLYSCQSYTVQIIPTTKTMDGELQQIDTETKSIVAQAPSNFQAIGLYPNSLELSAQDSDLNNKCETIFARFTCELTKSSNVPYQKAEQYVEGQVGGISFKALLSPLSPYTEYKCNVALFNIAGWSANRTIIKRTEPYFPDPPEEVEEKKTTNSSINFSWKAPTYPNGNIKLYILHFQRVEAAYYVPPTCDPIVNEPIPRETSSLEQSFLSLLPYTTYSIQVAAQNEYGVGEYSMPYMVKTEPWISDPVVNLKVLAQGPYESVTEYKANVVLTWTAPCKSNGEIEAFLLEFVGERTGYEREYFSRAIAPQFNDLGGVTYNETNLRAAYNYTVSVAVKTRGVELAGAQVVGSFDAPAGIPERLEDNVVAQAQVDAYEASNPTSSAVVRFPASILDSESGSIQYVALLLSEKNCNSEPELRYGAIDTNLEWPDSLSWNEVYDDGKTGCIEQYQTTPLRWKPSTSRSDVYMNDNGFVRLVRSTDEIEYTIGTDNCEDTTKRFCNGPLKADTEYNLVLRLFTKSGYNDAAVLRFKTDSLIQLTIILISVISCLLLAFIAGFIYLWVTKRIVWKRESCHGIEDSFGNVIAKNFAIFYRDVSKREKIQREFKELTVVAMDLSYSASELGCNKNRYADIFPYDKNRVILDIDAEGSDYINASFIDGYRRKKEYIATQGPKPESTMDFWRMILQHNVRVIVMVTQFREGDVVKCHEYFPFKSKTINVTVKKKECFEIYDRTEMSLTHDKYGVKQKVIHFYFKKWPDHGCPTDPNHLITFVRKVKAEKVPSFSPIVVHCSAGVGRTGTFIGLDIIMQRLRNESKINIYETVKKLRFQRMKMVQTLAQYKFLYSCAYELVKHKNTRAALKYQFNDNKKVSFHDDPAKGTMENSISMKANGRRTGSDLSSVEEHDGGSRDEKDPELGDPNTIPIRFNGFHKESAKELDEVSLDDTDSVKAGRTESVM